MPSSDMSREVVERLLERWRLAHGGQLSRDTATTLRALLADRDKAIARAEATEADLIDIAQKGTRVITELESRVKELEGALLEIDTLNPEGKVDGCPHAALRGLVLRMGEIARDVLDEGTDNA